MSSDLPPIRPARGEPLRCPVCSGRLIEVERSGVTIDACMECRGVWLDRGELDRILVMERRMAVGPGEDEDFLGEVEGRGRGHSDRPDERGNRGEERPHKRRRLLEDLLDFG